MKPDPNKIEELLTRGVDEVIEKDHLKKRLLSGEKLRVKFGIDPTSKDLHLGHSVPLRKLAQFQELGHQVILLIGDFTATIGDPSGRSETRPRVTREQIKQNLKTYVKQAGLILNMKKTEVRYNSEWYDKKRGEFLMELTAKFTIARIMERDDFKNRLKQDQDISVLEVLYPMLQGYDSVELGADVEIGGTDQKFNLLMGRKVQRRYGRPEQDILTVPIIEGLDGVHKMSKSLDNYIGITEDAASMYGKVMAVPDSLIWKYFAMLTAVPLDEVEKMKEGIRLHGTNPRDAKMRLAREIVTLYHGEAAAKKAEEQFVKTFQRHETPSEISEIRIKDQALNIVELLVRTKLATSKGEARRVIEQGGVQVDGKVVRDPNAEIKLSKEGILLQKGKRHFVKAVNG